MRNVTLLFVLAEYAVLYWSEMKRREKCVCVGGGGGGGTIFCTDGERK
jgi:hypothetical protein